MERFMSRAIELALQNVEEGGQPFGAILVKDGEIIAEGVNELHKIYDVSGHAEIIAIRKAQESLQTLDLSDCVIYASGEPCPMCMTAIYYSKIPKVYYCKSIEDAKRVGLGLSSFIYKDLALPREERTIEIKQIPMDPEVEDPLEMWKMKRPV